MARHADAATVFADFAALRRPSGAPVEVPIAEGDALANEWAVDRRRPRLRGVPAGLGAARRDRARRPGRRRPALRGDLDLDPRATRRAAQAAARLAGNADAGVRATGSRSCWPTARWRMEQPAPALTALTNRMLAYVEAR